MDDLFKNDELDHPKLRYWKTLAEKHGRPPVVEVHRTREGLGFGPASLYVSVSDESGAPVAPLDREPWEAQLALATVEQGWQGPNLENEAVRFGLLLKFFFAQPELRYGDGYFSSVLVTMLRDSDFARDPKLSSVIDLVHVTPPASSASRSECEEMIKAILGRVVHLLVQNLRYDSDEAKTVLTESLAYYLDDRFSISSGKLLGLYR